MSSQSDSRKVDGDEWRPRGKTKKKVAKPYLIEWRCKKLVKRPDGLYTQGREWAEWTKIGKFVKEEDRDKVFEKYVRGGFKSVQYRKSDASTS